MIIAFSGDLGSGKSTIAKMISEELRIPRFYMGQILRDLAKEKNMTLVELLKKGENDPTIDKDADDYVLKLAKENENFLIESRTAWHFIPDSIKIYFQVEQLEGAHRIYGALLEENSRNEDRGLESVEDVMRSNKKRMAGDIRRYKQYYNIDISDMKNYDFVINTTHLNPIEVFNEVMNYLKSDKRFNG